MMSTYDDVPESSTSQAGLHLPIATGMEANTQPPVEDADEQEEIRFVNWRALVDRRTYLEKKNILKLVLFLFILGIVAFIIAEQDRFATWLEPFLEKLKALPAGGLIPIAVLFVISFPPLFGHEIVLLLVGIAYGFGAGFEVAAAGTLLGEIGTFFVFKYLCAARAGKLEKKSLRTACLATVVREGGLLVAVVTRYSVIPSHLTTAIYATCGLRFWIFLAAAVVGLPKQMSLVYLGVILQKSSAGTETSVDKSLAVLVTLVSTAVTIASALWVYRRMRLVLPRLVEERRMKRVEPGQAVAGDIPLQLYTVPVIELNPNTDSPSVTSSAPASGDPLIAAKSDFELE